MRSKGLAMRIYADSGGIPGPKNGTWGTHVEKVRR
jgi:hypothetical protein